MRPFILIEVEDNTVSDTTVVGDVQLSPVVVDWDLVNGDSLAAQSSIDEIMEFFDDPRTTPAEVVKALDRLQDIVDEAALDDDADEDDEDEEDDEDDFIEEDDDEDMDMDEEDGIDPDVVDEDDEKKESDYADASEFNS